jgi:hypothetical protein
MRRSLYAWRSTPSIQSSFYILSRPWKREAQAEHDGRTVDAGGQSFADYPPIETKPCELRLEDEPCSQET